MILKSRILHKHEDKIEMKQIFATVNENILPISSKFPSSGNVCPPSGSIAALYTVQKLGEIIE